MLGVVEGKHVRRVNRRILRHVHRRHKLEAADAPREGLHLLRDPVAGVSLEGLTKRPAIHSFDGIVLELRHEELAHMHE